MGKLNNLKTKEYAYSSGSEFQARDKAVAVVKEIKARESVPGFQCLMSVNSLSETVDSKKEAIGSKISIKKRTRQSSSERKCFLYLY